MPNVTVKITDKAGHVATVVKPYAIATAARKPLMGASTADNTKFNTLVTAIAPAKMKCRRTYDGALPASFSASKAFPDVANNMASYWSWKPAAATFATDTAAQTAFSNFLNTVPAGHALNIITWHEPEDNINAAQFTLVQWKAMIKKVGEIVKSKNRPELRSGICLMGPWTFDTRGAYDLWDWTFTAAELAVIDFVGIDPYRWNPGDPSLQTILTVKESGTGGAATSLPTMTKLGQWGKPVVLTEWGCTRTGVTEADAAAWITAAYNWMKTQNAAAGIDIEAAMYFNNNLDLASEPRANWELTGATMTAFKNAVQDASA